MPWNARKHTYEGIHVRNFDFEIQISRPFRLSPSGMIPRTIQDEIENF